LENGVVLSFTIAVAGLANDLVLMSIRLEISKLDGFQMEWARSQFATLGQVELLVDLPPRN
jgi:hypothetical protein